MYDANFNVDFNWIFSSRERTRLADTVPDSPNKLSRFVVLMTKRVTKMMMRMTRRMTNGLMRMTIEMIKGDVYEKLSQPGLVTDVSSAGSRWQWTRYIIIIIIAIVIVIIIVIVIVIVIAIVIVIIKS